MTDQLPRTALAGRTFAAVLFDLDGTLVDSTAAVVRSWVTWAVEHDVDPVRLQGFHGVPSQQIVREVLGEERLPGALARIDELELQDVDGVVVLPGASQAIAAVPGGRAAIVTSCTRRLAAARIGASGLLAPQVVVTADDVTRGKPDPEPFLLGAQRLGVAARACLVVEDAPSGLAAARAAGMATLAVTTTTSRSELDADLVVGTLEDVVFRAVPDGIQVVAG
ncbi:HAD-IA family hydrolase [Angustibacter luteus]|uniref:HAD-IA family hydrolase n=1 Tax=Angustibacter luteus TaxID=658456 RepID=A0ABW1J8Q4_9ACTN